MNVKHSKVITNEDMNEIRETLKGMKGLKDLQMTFSK